MEKLSPPERTLAGLLGFLAGMVDAVGFLAMGGFFVSFMSGNTTRMGVGFASHWPDAWTAVALIAAFVAGVAAGSLLASASGRRRRAAVLLFVAVLLAVSPFIDQAYAGPFPLIIVAAAMGAENAVFEHNGDVRFGLTYMTGALVKTGQRIALALRGGPRFNWVPHLAQWGALAAGASAGAVLHASFGLATLWIAAGLAALLAVAALRLPPQDA